MGVGLGLVGCNGQVCTLSSSLQVFISADGIMPEEMYLQIPHI